MFANYFNKLNNAIKSKNNYILKKFIKLNELLLNQHFKTHLMYGGEDKQSILEQMNKNVNENIESTKNMNKNLEESNKILNGLFEYISSLKIEDSDLQTLKTQLEELKHILDEINHQMK